MTNELRECSDDWIMKQYIQDDKNYNACTHGVYRLAKPRQIICSKCRAVIIDTKEMDSISDWMNSLCRGA